MDFLIRFGLCILLMGAAYLFTIRNRTIERPAGISLYAFLLNADNFNDWGRLWRIVLIVSFLAATGVLIMKMVAILLGGPIVDLDKLK